MRRWSVTNEELRSICVRTSVCHRQNTFVSVGVPNLFVLKLLTVYGNSACAITSGRVTALHHESINNSVKFVALVVFTLTTVLSSTKSPEVFTGLWHIFE